MKVKEEGYVRRQINVYCLETLSILSSRAEREVLNIGIEDLDPTDSYQDHESILPHEDMQSTAFDRSQDRSGG